MPNPTSTTATALDCATCTRSFDPDRADSPHWLSRPDGLGLLCPTCQRRIRHGQPTQRQASR